MAGFHQAPLPERQFRIQGSCGEQHTLIIDIAGIGHHYTDDLSGLIWLPLGLVGSSKASNAGGKDSRYSKIKIFYHSGHIFFGSFQLVLMVASDSQKIMAEGRGLIVFEVHGQLE